MSDSAGASVLCQKSAARRMSRLPEQTQWALLPELAIAIVSGRATGRPEFKKRTYEHRWSWEHEVSPSGHWLISERYSTRAKILIAMAERTAAERPEGWSRQAVVRLIRQYGRTRKWLYRTIRDAR